MKTLRTICFLLLALSGSLEASITGQLSGRVTDGQGSELPGVSVMAASPSQIGGGRTTQTDALGIFRFPRLAPGVYQVRLELEGFVTQELTEVQVRVDRTTEVHVILPPGTFGDEVTVIETTPVVDPQQVSAGQTFTSDYLQEASIGMDHRHYLSMLNQTAGVEGGAYGSALVLGSSAFENAYLIDGIDTTEPLTGLPTYLSLSFEAIDEVVLHTAGFEAEYGRATGGVVNLVTKSGGNRFAGSVDYRFRDNNFETRGAHYDPDEQPGEISDLTAALGGPIASDQAWFFLSFQKIDDKITPTGSPSTVGVDQMDYLAKLTWQVNPNWSLVGKVFGNAIDTANVNASQFVAEDANAREKWEPLNGNVELNGILSDRLLLGLKAGVQNADWSLFPSDGDFSAISHYNYDTGLTYGNFDYQDFETFERRDFSAEASWFADDFGGSHDLKGGIVYGETGFGRNVCYTGSGQPCTRGVEGYLFGDVTDGAGNNLPFEFWVRQAFGQQDFDGSLPAAYVQDSWRPRADLTLKLGLRWDGATYDTDTGEEIADLAMLQPRLGVAWDVLKDGRNILRASWGQFMWPASLHVAGFSSRGATPLEFWLSCSAFVSGDPEECAAIAGAIDYGYRTDQEAWDPAGWVLDPELVWRQDPNQVAEDLEPMYAEEVVLAFERELFRRTALELSYVKKDTRDAIEDTCIENYPTPTPGGGCRAYIIANIPQARKSYTGWLLRFETRALDRLHLVSSYVYSESKGSLDGWYTSANFDRFPFQYENRYGYLSDHSRHRIKLNGFAFLPYDLSLGVGGYWSSEFRWTPIDTVRGGGTIFVEPRGSRSESGPSELDLQLVKGFRIGPTRLRLIGTVYNLLDSEGVLWVCERIRGCGAFELGDPVEWQQPRRYELGVRVEF